MTQPIVPMIDAGRRPPAQLTNMRLAMQTMMQIHEAPIGVPRIGVLHGFSGYGKTVAAAHVASYMDALFVTADPVWTQRAMLEAIGRELGITRLERSAPRLLTQIIDQLASDRRPLIIDETDYIVDRDWIEIIRAVHDKAQIPVLLIGEESLPAKLKKRERFDNRILVATPAEPATLEDAILLRDHYCLSARIADDLVAAIVAACKGVTRRIVVNLQAVQARALQQGRDTINLDAWGDAPFMTGQIQTRRPPQKAA